MRGLVPASEARAIAALDEAKRAIERAREAGDVDALREWRDRAVAVQHYARARADARATADDAGEIRLRAEAALGTLDRETAPRGRRSKSFTAIKLFPPLDDFSTATRAAWRKLGALDGELDDLIRRMREDENGGVTTAHAIRMLAAQKDAERKERGQRRRDHLGAEEDAAETGQASFLLGDLREHLPSLAGANAALLLTDPPYGVDYRSSGFRWASGPFKRIIGDGHADEATAGFADALALALDGLATDAHILTFCGWRIEPAFRDVLEAAGLTVRSSVVWVKNEPGLGDVAHSFGPMHERVLHATRGDATMRYRAGDVITCPRVVSGRHPTEKPVELLDQLIRATTNPGDLVIDPFAGVASTLVAAVDAGRHAWGCEIDPEYHEHGLQRL